MSDEEADLSPEDPSEEAIMALAIAQADELVHDRLTECGADPDTAFPLGPVPTHLLYLALLLFVFFNV